MSSFRFRAGAWLGVAIGVLVAAGSAAAAPSGRVTINGSTAPVAASAPQVGPVAGLTSIDFSVDLKLPDLAGAQEFAQAVSTPGNPAYRQYLTPAQWEARFSPAQSSVKAVESFLTQNGFTVNSVSADRMAVSASGTATEVEQAFGTSLAYHRVQGHSLVLAGKSLSIPSDLAGIVSGVAGVNQVQSRPATATSTPAGRGIPGVTRSSAASPSASGPIPPPQGFRNDTPCGAYYGQQIDTTLPPLRQGYPHPPPWAPCGYVPPQFRSAYGLTGADDGAGVTVAILDAYASPTLFSDAHKYFARHDPGNPLRQSQFSELLANSFNQTGPNQCDGSSWYVEQAIDVEAVHSTAPGANILFAGAKNCSGGLDATLRRIVDGHLAEVVSNSYGGPEQEDDTADRTETDDILVMAAGTGVSVLYSSGDDGDNYDLTQTTQPSYPASSPWATAVGGTTLAVGSRGQRLDEYGWSTGQSVLCNPAAVGQGVCANSQIGTWGPISFYAGSGGGTSSLYAEPPYQQGVVPPALARANGSTPGRVDPDISMNGDPFTGMLLGFTQTFPDGVYYGEVTYGGTSLSSPLFAGVVARADQAAGYSEGFLNGRLYSLYGNRSALYDILPTGKQYQTAPIFADGVDNAEGTLDLAAITDYQGQEQYCDPTTGACTSQKITLSTAPGYDDMTGLGSPGNGFVDALGRQ